ncbi:MAG: metallophosphoesterase [Promethearchaeota archaeon]
MRFIAFSDFHGAEYKYKNAKTIVNEINELNQLDFIVICGDLTTRGSILEAQSLLELAEFPVNTYFVFGNMDYFDNINQNLENANNIHLNPIKIEDYDLIGIGGDRQDIKQDINAAKKIINNLKSKFLVLITHVAPYMHCDIAYNNSHIGSKHLTDLIKDIQKEKNILVCCGHVHEQWTCNAKLGNAEIWNVGPNGILFELDDFKINAQLL